MSDIKRFDTSLTNFSEVNNGFIRATVNVFTKDQVANGFEFQEECIERRRKQWSYVPVVAEYIEEKEDLGGHGGKLTIDDEGMRYERTTLPMGVVIDGTDRYEDRVCLNGETKQYFCVDVYLWYEQFEKELSMFKNGESRAQSMEVKILNSTYEEGIEKVYDFEPLALCILGKDVDPAFVDSKVKVGFQSDEFKANFNQMMFALDKFIKNNEKGDVDLNTEELMNEENAVLEEETVEDTVETQEEVQEEVEMREEEKEEAVIETDEEQEEMKKKKKCSKEEVNYEEKFNELSVAYAHLEEENTKLKEQFNEVSGKYQAYVDAELAAQKEVVIESFRGKLTGEEIEGCLGEYKDFTVEEVETKLTLALGKKVKMQAAEVKFEETKQEEKEFANLNTFNRNNYFSQLAKKIKNNN